MHLSGMSPEEFCVVFIDFIQEHFYLLAKQQSVLRLQPIFEMIKQTSEVSSNSLQSVPEVIRLRSELEAFSSQAIEKKVEELTDELKRVRAEAEQERISALKAASDQLKEIHAAEIEKVKSDMMATQSKQVEQLVASHKNEAPAHVVETVSIGADSLGLGDGDNGMLMESEDVVVSSLRENSTRLIERVEEKRNERSIPTPPVLVIGNCDIFSPLIDKLLALSRAECTFHKIEVTICKLAKVLQFRVKAIGEARNIQMKLIEEDHAVVPDLSIAPLSDVWNVMKEAEKDKDEEERSSPYSRAAETAAAEAIEDLMSRGQKTTKKTWLRMCPLGQKVKVLVYRAAQLLAVCRVLQMMPFVDFLDTATTDEKFKKKVFSAIAGMRFEKIDCASVLEMFIIPTLQIGAPEENKQLCFDLLVLMTSMGKN